MCRMLSTGSAKESWFLEYPEGEQNSKPETLCFFFGTWEHVGQLMPRNLRLSVLGLVLCLRNASFTCQGFPDQEGRECEGEAFSRLAAVFQNEAPYEQPNGHEYTGCWNWIVGICWGGILPL